MPLASTREERSDVEKSKRIVNNLECDKKHFSFANSSTGISLLHRHFTQFNESTVINAFADDIRFLISVCSFLISSFCQMPHFEVSKRIFTARKRAQELGKLKAENRMIALTLIMFINFNFP